MLKRLTAVLLLTALFVSPVSAETLSDFMFRTTKSWNAVSGEASLLPIVSAEKIGYNRYQMHIQLKERGSVEAKIDKIIVHVFDDGFESEDAVRNSAIGTVSVSAMASVELNEILEASEGQWVGYEFIVGGKSFLGISKCGEYKIDEEQEESEEAISTEDREESADEITIQDRGNGLEETENVMVEELQAVEEEPIEDIEVEEIDELAESMEAESEELEEPVEDLKSEESVEDLAAEEPVEDMKPEEPVEDMEPEESVEGTEND